MSDRELQEIQALQFRDRDAANGKLLNFINANLPFKVAKVEVRPLAVSLNSINGFITKEDGEKLFFKTHIEPQSIIHEYYNSSILAEAGYPVIQPIFSSTEWGKQLLIYKYFDAPSLFNVARDIETNKRDDEERIIALQEKADEQLREIYFDTVKSLTSQEHKSVPVHQLFFHRLTGGRLREFYEGKEILLPGSSLQFEELAGMKWRINGLEYQDTINELIQRAIALLNPELATDLASIVGHGDAHNGNVFVDEDKEELIYFDPAFAGRHSPFLDLTKPLFHNVFAIWMYFPKEIAEELSINWEIKDGKIVVEHDFKPSAIRVGFLRSKIRRVLKPLLEELRSRNCLSPQWREYLKLALFCCPFLTMNLSDRQKFPPEITLLGLAISVEMGSSTFGDVDSFLDAELGGS
ncbi:MAG: phosphotransferase [Cyanobacteriota bacterium]|nr:phosphotransferase [Cyanobacteriota bacterium]